MSTGQPNGSFSIITDALPTSGSGAPKRPATGGGNAAKRFAVSDRTNSALLPIGTPSYMTPRENPNGPRYKLATPEVNSGRPLDLMLGGTTGLPGVGDVQSRARPNTGLGGMSAEALQHIAKVAGRVGSQHIVMPGSAPSIGLNTRGGEMGLPIFAGFESPAGKERAIGALAPGNANLISRTNNNLAFRTGEAFPSDLNFQAGLASPDPRFPGRVPNGAGGSPLDGLFSQTSQDKVDAITEKRLAEETNATLPHTLIMRPFAPNFSSEDLYGQFILVHRSLAALNENERTANAMPGHADASLRHTALSVTAWNYMMASREADPTNGDPTKYSKSDDRPATLIAKFWEFSGLVINDRTLSVRNPENRVATNGVDRLLNRCVAGTARAFNYWGRNALRSNCRLFFILKRVPRKQLAMLSNGRPLIAEGQRYLHALQAARNGASALLSDESVNTNTLYFKLGEKGDFQIVYETDNEGRQLHPFPFQLVPYATDSSEGVPLRDRMYYELDGSKAYGIVYEVGNTYEPQTSGDVSSSAGSMLSVKSLTDAGQLNIAVKIETCAF